MRDYDMMLAVVVLAFAVSGVWLYTIFAFSKINRRIRRLEARMENQMGGSKTVPRSTRSITDFP